MQELLSPVSCNQRRPLMLWFSSHTTLAAEEIPLLLEAGFRVIPLLTDFWTYQYDPSIDGRICNQWKESVDLPPHIVHKLQSLPICANEGQNEISGEVAQLLNKHVDVCYVTVLPNLAIRLAQVFDGTVMFRPFGHGELNTYTRIAAHYRADINLVPKSPNFMWTPILSTLQEPEDPRLCHQTNHLGAFVSPERLGPVRWSAGASQPYVVETIPRITKQNYYMDMYRQYQRDHGHLPIKILGGNPPQGGSLLDPNIVGFLDDHDYYRYAAQARVSIYHGKSRYHVHYHPIEFMALGVPVLFHENSAIAAEGMHAGMSSAELQAAGMYRDVNHANDMAALALKDASLAQSWSDHQRYFIDEVFSRRKALDQARWLKLRIEQLKHWYATHPEQLGQQRAARTASQAAVASPINPVALASQLEPKPTKRPIPVRVYREIKRALRKTLRSA